MVRIRRAAIHIAEEPALDELQQLLLQKKSRELSERLTYYPLASPGMPSPGPDFLLRARALGQDVSQFATKTRAQKAKEKAAPVSATAAAAGSLSLLDRLYIKALRKLHFRMQVTMGPDRRELTSFLPGHLWDKKHHVDGPVRAEVMVVGKMPGENEIAEGRNLVGPSGKYFLERLDEYKIQGYENWYVTNLVKFATPPGKSLRAGWVKECLPLLHQELRLVRPKYLICLGADASKAVLGPKATVASMMGRLVEYTYPISAPGLPIISHTTLVMTLMHPAAVLHLPDSEAEFDVGVCRLGQMVQGVRFDRDEAGIDHRVVDTPDGLQKLLQEVDQIVRHHKDPVYRNVVAVDAEWHGQHPQNDGAYLRTIQISWGAKRAACIVMRRQGGKLVSAGWSKFAVSELNRFFRGKRVVGHFFNSDMEWLQHAGIDLAQAFSVPCDSKQGVSPWLLTRTEGGMDTGLAFHAIQETAKFGLETLALRFTTAPRYDIPLEDWKKEYCKQQKLKPAELEGYGDCPDEVLYPYANYDADVTYRLYGVASGLLDRDYDGNNCRKPFWRNMAACPAALEINTSGIRIDRERVDFLTTEFLAARHRVLKRLRQWAKWPAFNINSVQHVREFLFGEKYNGKAWENGQPHRLRPEDARSLELRPVTNTGKRPTSWEDIAAQGPAAERENSPSTNRTTLGILGEENPQQAKQVMLLRDYRFLNQGLNSVLKPPSEPEGGWDSDDELKYSGGILGVLCGDGCIRTHMYQTKSTGRWSSARPALQNWSKTRDKDYARMLGERYRYPLRSIARAHLKTMAGAWCQEDTVFLEADYKGAELCGMAWMSGDPTMTDHVRRNLLSKSDPEYYDIHSNIAVLAFRLDCDPTEAGLDAIKKVYLRNIAKTVVFGIAYGRGAKAIAFAAREEGVQIAEKDAQQVIDTIFDLYPGLVPFFDACRARVYDPGWLSSCFHRFRRFPYTDEVRVRKDQERQAMNFPIQSMIADAADDAMANLLQYRTESGDHDLFRFKLQLHDAILFEVPVSRIDDMVPVVKLCMCECVPVYPTDLAGQPVGRGPYHLGVSVDVYEHWAEKISAQRGRQLGVPAKYCAV